MVSSRRDVFHAIADPTRRDILSLIANKSMNPNSIAENFQMSRPAVSQHIKILSECGLVTIKKEGRMRYYQLQPDKLSEVAEWVEPFRKLWENRFKHLDNLLNDLKTESKNE